MMGEKARAELPLEDQWLNLVKTQMEAPNHQHVGKVPGMQRKPRE